MENYDKVLSKFEDSCLSKAKIDKSELEANLEIEIQKNVEEQIDVYRKKLESRKKIAIDKLEKDYNTSIWELENKARQKLLNAEENCKKILFNELKEELINFTNSSEYKDFLKTNLLEAYNLLSNKDNLIIKVVSKDKNNYEFYIKEILNNYEISIDELKDEYIGGVFIQGKSEIIDNTILTNLKEKINENKDNF